jgi:hypothetical protein
VTKQRGKIRRTTICFLQFNESLVNWDHPQDGSNISLRYSGPFPQAARLAGSGQLLLDLSFDYGLYFNGTMNCNYCCNAMANTFEVGVAGVFHNVTSARVAGSSVVVNFDPSLHPTQLRFVGGAVCVGGLVDVVLSSATPTRRMWSARCTTATACRWQRL